MSDEARTILVVTDDPCFSGQLSELMLRAGVRTLRFVRTRDALEHAANLRPDLVLIHIPRGGVDTGWACYELLQSDPRIASIPVLLYVPPLAQVQRLVGAPGSSRAVYPPAVSDTFVAQLTSLIGTSPSIWCPVDAEPAEQRFPIGRDDL